jgi:hypothetical protein
MNAERNADSRSKAQKVLQKSEQQGRNEFVVDYDEMNPFALDCAALKPIYKVNARTPLSLPSPAPFALSLCRSSFLPHEHLLTFLPLPLSSMTPSSSRVPSYPGLSECQVFVLRLRLRPRRQGQRLQHLPPLHGGPRDRGAGHASRALAQVRERDRKGGQG